MSSSQWVNGLFGSISYTGSVGIGTTGIVPPTAKLQVVGNVAVSGDITASGNMIAATPTAPNHLATKAYVDAAVVS